MMEIYVKLRTKTITLHVQPYDTIEVVKAKIQDKEGLPRPTLAVRLMFKGKELRDGRTIAHHDIEMLNTLIYIEGGMQIYVKLRKKCISLDVEASDTIENVKMKIQDKFSCS